MLDSVPRLARLLLEQDGNRWPESKAGVTAELTPRRAALIAGELRRESVANMTVEEWRLMAAIRDGERRVIGGDDGRATKGGSDDDLQSAADGRR